MKTPGDIRPWSTETSEHVIRDRWLRVRADRCKTPNGAVVSPYYVLEYADWVNMVVLDDKDRILVTHHYRHGNGKVAVEIPCGIRKPIDKSARKAAKRELLEETGYEGKFELAAKYSPNPATHDNTVYCYLVTDPRQVYAGFDNPMEPIASEFKELAEIMALIDSGEFCQAMHISSIFLALRKAGKLSGLVGL